MAQRDYLKNHPEKVLELNHLKEKFEGKSMDEYGKEKGEFFERILEIYKFIYIQGTQKMIL